VQASTDSEVRTALHKAASALRIAAEVMARHREMNDYATICDNAGIICVNWIEGMKRDRDNGEN
jgi:hypothetical protein